MTTPPCISQLAPELVLQVCKYLPSKPLGRLSQTCHYLNEYATWSLYEHDAKDGGSYAIQYAVLLSCVNPRPQNNTVAGIIFRKAIQHGANVNANHPHQYGDITVLTIAAAFGRADWVGVLLQHGASAHVESKSPCKMPAMREHTRKVGDRGHHLRQLLGSSQILLPLCLPMIFGFKDVVKLLIRDGRAPAELTHDQGDEVLTVHHVCAYNGGMGSAKAFIKSERFRHAIDEQQPGNEGTALVGAIKNRNVEVFHALLEAGADMNLSAADHGDTPLISAIRNSMSTADKFVRRTYVDFVEKLVEAGADVNARGTQAQTPLMVVMEAPDWDNGQATKIMKTMIYLLLEHGADVNAITTQGETALWVLVRKAMSRGKAGMKTLETVIKELVRDYGANLGQQYYDKTILGFFLGRLLTLIGDGSPSKSFVEELVKLGGRLTQEESDKYFLYWITNTKGFRSFYGWDIYGSNVDQDKINQAYNVHFQVPRSTTLSPVDLNLLLSIGQPDNPEIIVWNAFQQRTFSPKMA